MDYFQEYTFSTANVFLQDLATFVAANGWTVDIAGAYDTSHYRVHFHQDEAHFDIHSVSAAGLQLYGCTGYASGAVPSAQPGVSGGNGKTITGVSEKNYRFISTVGGIYIGITNTYNTYTWGACFRVLDKIGSWLNGFGLQGMGSAPNFFLAPTAYDYNPGGAQLYYNAKWSPNVAAGGFCGNGMSSDLIISQPCSYNDAILPIKLVLFIRNTTNSSLFHPIGYAPGLYRTNGGDTYVPGDEIIIGSDTYKIFPAYAGALGNTTYHDLLFKLGA